MRALSAGIQSRDIRSCVGIDVYSAHKIVVAGEYRDKVLCHVYACIEQVLIDHWESALYELGVFMGDVEIELIRACTLCFKDYRM